MTWFRSKPRKPINYIMDKEDFEHLVRGGELRITSDEQDVHIIQADIGFIEQMCVVNQAMLDGKHRLNKIREVQA